MMVSSPELLSMLFTKRNTLARVLVWRSTTFGELKLFFGVTYGIAVKWGHLAGRVLENIRDFGGLL